MYAKNREALLLCEQLCLLPERRPDYTGLKPEARAAIDRFGLDPYGLHHSVVRDRLGDADGRPVAVR